MCSPKVAQVVWERIQKEGLSQRSFLRLGGVTATSAAVASLLGSAAAVQAQGVTGEVIDLSYVFGTNIPTYLPGENPQHEDFVTVENDGFYIQRWTFTEHAGTHVDIPAHFVADGETVDNYPADYRLRKIDL